MEFKPYLKIKRLGSEENEGILLGKVFIQEKIDGANLSCWLKEDGIIGVGSRTQDVSAGGFNGAVEYIRSHKGICELLKQYPYCRLYFEWLVRHTVSYDETKYKKAYLYDIFDHNINKFWKINDVYNVGEEFEIEMPELFATLENPSLEEIMPFVGKSALGQNGEGVVLKNFDFVNKFGDTEYAKIVTEKFKEDNAITFGGNNRHSETYWEMFCVNKYISLSRVEKIMNKIQPLIEHKLGIEDTARIIHTVYHDFWIEKCWKIQKEVPSLNFRKLSQLSCRKAAQIYHDILNNSISVADQN